MAAILEITDQAVISELGRRVETVFREYKAHVKSPSPTPKEMRETFDNLSRRYRELYDSLNQLRPEERKIFDTAGQDLHFTHDMMWWAFAHKTPDFRLRDRRYGRPHLAAAACGMSPNKNIR